MQRKVTAFLIGTSLVALSAAAVSVNGGTPPYENSILDLAVTNCGGDDVSVLLNDGTGDFSNRQDYSVGDDPRGIGKGDFNRDGILDLAVTNNDADSVSVLIGDGEGAFGDRQDYSVGDGPKSVVAGDFDEDGDLDLAVTNCYDNDISILIGDGEGGFGNRQDYPVREWPRHIVAGDFDKDGDLDLALTNCYGNVVSILLNDGTGDFSNRQDYPVGNHPIGIAAGDFNEDQVLDLAVANYGGDDVSVLLNDGTGDFSNRQDYPVGNHPIGIAAGDFNGDGIIDLAVTNRCDNYTSILIGDGEGGFDRQDYPAGDSLVGIVAGDFNGDDDLDLAVTDENDDVVSILLNDGTGNFDNRYDYPVGNHPWGIVTGDFDLQFKLYIPHLRISTEAGTRIFYSTDDTWLNKPDHPDDPLGYYADMWVRNTYGAGGSDIYQFDALVRFDVSSIPSGTTILSATLNLYYYKWHDNDPVDRNLCLYRVTSDWDEETATWNTQPFYAPESTACSTVPPSTGVWMRWDVTSDVRGFLDQLYSNYGWKITDEEYWGQSNIPITYFCTKEYRPFIRGDTDNNMVVSMSDAIFILQYLYVPGAPPPPAPGPDTCGLDPTPDDLDCEDHPCQHPPTVSLSKSEEVDGNMVFGNATIQDQKVIVPVYLENNRPLSGFAYTISYEPSVLSFKSVDNVKLTTENFDFFSARPKEENGSVSVGSVVDLGLKKNLTPGYHEVSHLIFEFKAGKLEETILRFSDVQLVDTEAKPLSAHTNTCTIRIPSSIPRMFALHQTSPNPFTGETSIRYQLPKENHVVLKVYNGAGQMVNTLVNAMQKPGYYSVQWNGEDGTGMKVASGIYFYKIETKDYSSTKKMILLR